MSFEKSAIMRDYFEMAQKIEKNAFDLEKNPRQEDLKEIENKRLKTPEKSVLEDAHPKPVYVAEGHGDGGLVENLIEQQNEDLKRVNKMPTGIFVHCAIELLKIANECDALGKIQTADLITKSAENLLNFPFVQALEK